MNLEQELLRRLAQVVNSRGPAPLEQLPVQAALPSGLRGPLNAAYRAALPSMLKGPAAALGYELAQRGAKKSGEIGEAVAGEMLLGPANIVAMVGDPNDPDTQLAQEIANLGPGRPREVVERLRHADNPVLSWGAGGLAMVADPLNLLPAAKPLTAGTRAARIGRMLEAVDRAQSLPLEGLAAAAKGGNTFLRGQLARRVGTDAASIAGDVPVDQMLKFIGKEGGRGIGPVPPPPITVLDAPVRPAIDLPLTVERPGDYNQAAKAAGFPGLPKREIEPAALLAPDEFNIVREAKRLNLPGEIAAKEAAKEATLAEKLAAKEAALAAKQAAKDSSAAEKLAAKEAKAAALAAKPIQSADDLLMAGRRTAESTELERLQSIVERLKLDQPRADVPVSPVVKAAPPIARNVDQLPLAPAKNLGGKPSAPLREGFDSGQQKMIDDYRITVREGTDDEVREMEEWLTDTMGVRPDTIATVKKETLREMEDETLMDGITSIEQSPYFLAFKYFDKYGDLKKVNPITKDRLRKRPEVGNLTGNGYDELAANLQGDYGLEHNQNWGETAEDFWIRAQKLFKEYRKLRQLKQGAKQAELPRPRMGEVADAGMPPEAITMAEERAARAVEPPDIEGLPWMPREMPQQAVEAPDLGGVTGTRDEILAGLDGRQTRVLLELAYGPPNAIKNAQNKYRDPVALRARAIERIGLANKMGQLAKRDPELARIVANLPEVDAPTTLPDAPGTTEVANKAAIIARGKAAKDDLFSDAADLPKKGGDTFNILPSLGGIAGREVSAALTGAVPGAMIGAYQDDENRLRGAAKGAVAGAVVGTSAGAAGRYAAPELARIGERIVQPHPLLRASWNAGAAAWKEAADKSTGSVVSAAQKLGTTWRINMTHHLRNLIGDDVWGRIIYHGADGGTDLAVLREVRNEMAPRMENLTPWEREPDSIRALQRVFGREGKLPDVGDSLAQSEKAILTVTDTLYGEMALSLFNPAAFATNAAGLAFAGVKGALRPALRGFFEAFNGFQQATFRRGIYQTESEVGLRLAAQRFLPDLQAQGVDVSRLSPDGMFTAAEVRALAGDAAATRWGALLDGIRENAERRTKFLFGDYSNRNIAEKMVGGAIPFISWLVRAYPVAITMLAQHPAVALGLYHYLNATRPKEGQPGYTAGMIPISTTVPVIGGILAAYGGGAEGTVYLDLLGAMTPLGGEVVRPMESDEGKNWYQRTQAWLDRLGIPGFNPVIQNAAYVAGLDFKASGNTSRTAGIEQGLGMLPLNPQLPNIGADVLRGVRGAVSPIAEGTIPGAKGDKTPEKYDPITRRYAELVYRETGKPLNHKDNKVWLFGMADPDNELLQQARQEVLLGGATKNVVSMSAPVGMIAQSDQNKEYRRAAKGMPFTYDQIGRKKAVSPELARLMMESNTIYRGQNPAADMYRVGTKEDAAWELLRQWENENKDFRFVIGETAYARIKRQQMERLGLVKPLVR